MYDGEVGIGGTELSIWKLCREEKVGIEWLMRAKKFVVRKLLKGWKERYPCIFFWMLKADPF